MNASDVTNVFTTNYLKKMLCGIVMLLAAFTAGNSFGATDTLPRGFVYLSDIDPNIVQDMRYASSHNFVGRRIDGYASAECILTYEAAQALKRVQAFLVTKGLSLIVWDCYRPVRAVQDFLTWTSTPDGSMKGEFFPRANKSQLFALGYLARHSHHSRGSAVDLAVVPAELKVAPRYREESRLAPCFTPKGERFEDGTLDFGTGHDCLDATASFANKEVGKVARDNRTLLRNAMLSEGFKPYEKEWWHFELRNEPFKTEFDFPVTAKR